MNCAVLAIALLLPALPQPETVSVCVGGSVPAGISKDAVQWMAVSALNSMGRPAVAYVDGIHQRPTLLIGFAPIGTRKAANISSSAMWPLLPATMTINSQGRWTHFGTTDTHSVQSTLHHEIYHLINFKTEEAEHEDMQLIGIPVLAHKGVSVVNQWSEK